MSKNGDTAVRLGELAERFELELRGDPDQVISGLGTLANAEPGQISFLANTAYAGQLAGCRASAVILAEPMLSRWQGNALVSPNPYASWARIAGLIRPPCRSEPGIHPTAWAHPSAKIHPTASIGPNSSIGAGSCIRQGVQVGAGCVIENDCNVGEDSVLLGRVYLGPGTRLGKRVMVHPGAVIGSDGFGLAMDQGRWLKVPQTGRVILGDDCEIGANTTIDRGAVEDTVLEEDVRLDNQVQVAHNVVIGAHTAIAGCVGIAGSTRIGRYCMIAGACGIGGHLTISDKVVITAMSTVLDSIHEPGEYGSGIPARPHRGWQRILVRLGQLDDWAKRLRRLENKQD